MSSSFSLILQIRIMRYRKIKLPFPSLNYLIVEPGMNPGSLLQRPPGYTACDTCQEKQTSDQYSWNIWNLNI